MKSNGQETGAADELNKLLQEDELREAVLLVFANKQDLPGACPVDQVSRNLGLNAIRNRQVTALFFLPFFEEQLFF